MRKIFIFILFFTLYFLLSNSVYADDLQSRIDSIRQQIQELERQSQNYKFDISKTHQEGESLKKEIASLNAQLKNLLIQIRITSNRITEKELEIKQLQDQIGDLIAKIDKSKLTTGQLVRELDEYDKVSIVTSILKYHQLSDIFNELQSNQNLQENILLKINELKDLKDQVNQKKTLAQGKKDKLGQLQLQNQSEKKNLNSAKGFKADLLTNTKGEETRYKQLLSEVEKKKTAFFQDLQVLELQARGQGAFIVHVTASSVPSKGTKIFQWPEDGYILTQGYGMTSYAKKGAYGGAGHNGVDLTSGYGSQVKSIGNGVVLASGFSYGWGNWVAIRHSGDLVSLYGHLSLPTPLIVGQRVDGGTVIGYEGATGNATGSHLHLSLYKDFFTYVSPKSGQLYFNYFEGTINPLDYM